MVQADSISINSPVLATLPQSAADQRARRIAFLEAGERLTRAEREELGELRAAGHEYRPHVERSTDEIKATLAYQRHILREQSRCVRVSAKSSLAARAALRAKFTAWGSYDCRCIRSGLREYLAAYTLTRNFVRTLAAEIERRGQTFAAAAE